MSIRKNKLICPDARGNTDGPFRKFWLIKQYGQMLRDSGSDPRTLSCAAIEAAIIALTDEG